jgi:DNA topoisomerase-3
VCKREITRDEALVYLRTGRTEVLTDFTSRFGRPFSATLVLKETGRHGFEFPPRGKAEGGGGGEARRRSPRRAKSAEEVEPKPKPASGRPARGPRKKRASRKKPAAGGPASDA